MLNCILPDLTLISGVTQFVCLSTMRVHSAREPVDTTLYTYGKYNPMEGISATK
jgi:hypothetical protein